MPRKLFFPALLVLVSLGLYAVATKPSAVRGPFAATHLNENPQQWIAAREQEVHVQSRIVPGAEKRIRWHDPATRRKTPWSVVYFHGYSASRQEIAPVPELVADALQANLFESRLRGHGIEVDPLYGATAEDWLNDGMEGLAIGAAIGSRVVVIGTSTGASLALALANQPEFDSVSAMVLISPNFAPTDAKAEMLTWPGGPDVARMTMGPTMSWTPRNELQAKYWTTTYPMESLVEMMRLVKYLRRQLPMRIEQRLLTIYSPRDSVVDPQETMSALAKIESPQKLLHEISDSADEGQHVLIGDILSPQSNAPAARAIADFVLGKAPPP